MIRRDYLLRMIEDFIRVLARIESFKKGQLWQEASQELGEQFQALIGAGPEAIVRMSDTEVMAKIIAGEPTSAVRDKVLMVTRLLKEAGETAAAQGNEEASTAAYMKGLHLLLTAISRDDALECPEYVPSVDAFVNSLQGVELPFHTQGLLMQHYENAGVYAKAEDALFAMVNDGPAERELLDFGISFYQRLQGRTDNQLAEGNLPRAEVEAGLKELREKRGTLNED